MDGLQVHQLEQQRQRLFRYKHPRPAVAFIPPPTASALCRLGIPSIHAMNYMRFKKNVRRAAAALGIYRPLRKLVFAIRGSNQTEVDSAFYRKIIRPGELVFDVGANRGQSSEIFIALGTRVVAFEPQKDLHGEIRNSCGKSKNLLIESCGLGGREEQRTFFITAYDQVASLRDDWEGVRMGESVINISTLDIQIARHGRPDYCKIDVEGWEPEVISGLSTAIPTISFEYHAEGEEINRARQVLERLSRLGDYHCNVKRSDDTDFALPAFIPIGDFISAFPKLPGLEIRQGYGDIFCCLDPSQLK